MIVNKLTFCIWNIHGYKSRQIGNKLHSDDFLNIIKDQDFIGLTETHIHDEILEDLSIPGFIRLCYRNMKKNQKSHTAPGGIAVFVKEHLFNLFSHVYSDNEDTIWVKIKKEVSKGDHDIYVGTHYVSPTSVDGNKTAKLMESVSAFQAKGHVLINGDFNARTGNQNDTIPQDKFDTELGIEIEENNSKRNSQDKIINKRGEEILDMCKSLNLYIANGRKVGDPFGSYTCLKWNGNSVVDYLLASQEIFDKVPIFKIGIFQPMLSDHCPLLYSLEITENIKEFIEEPTLKKAPDRYSWSDDGISKFLSSIKSPFNQKNLSSILESDFNDPNTIVDSLTNLLMDIADKSKIKRLQISNSNSKKNPPWFDKTCSKLKKEIISQGKSIKRDPKNKEQKRLLTQLKRSLRNAVRKNKLAYKETILQEMKWSIKKTKQFWKLLDKLEYKQNGKSFIQGITGENWKVHFKNVLQNPSQSENNILPENTTKIGPLDYEITKEEIEFGAYVLRFGKSPGIDNISNEMISCLLDVKPEIIVKLFNSILKHPVTIHRWHTSIISPIHKKGSKMNPDNYRGISLLSCFSKFFCAILNKRLLDYVINKQILSKAQLGFVPGNRTSDALLILYNLINYYCHKNKRHLYGCFVDFSKAFDTIPRKNLFQKLIDCNINGKFYDCLTMFYSGDQVCVKVGNKITENFQANRGVKQGCILSPLLFNIYLSDLQVKMESPEKKPAFISPNEPIGCLIWADDLLLISETEAGLDCMLKSLKHYATINGLTINIEKTKVMIFNKTGRHIRKNFYLGEMRIETSREYKYLGFKITPYGGITPGLHDLKDRALKAFYKMKHQMGSSFRKHPLVTIKLFETLIKPILLYASDFWGVLKAPKNNPIENMHIKFCKELLGVQKQTTNIGVLLELGQIPLGLEATKNAIKNWVRISNYKKCNNLVANSYKNSATENLSWPNRIKDTLSQIGMLDKFLNKDEKTHISSFQRLSDIFHQNTLHDIKKESSKLRTYSLLKTEIGYENYLSQIQNIQHRTIFTKLRLSNHCLQIETGRHQRIDKNNRFCPFCPKDIEDEIHFLLHCNAYIEIRKELFEKTKIKRTNLNQIENSRNFVYLLTNSELVFETARCIYRMFQCREFLLKNYKNTI